MASLAIVDQVLIGSHMLVSHGTLNDGSDPFQGLRPLGATCRSKEGDASVSFLNQLGDDLDEGGFPSPVFADQAVDVAFANGEIHII